MRNNHQVKTAVVFATLIAVCFPAAAQTTAAGNSIESKFATVDGMRIHYLSAGHGPAVVLLHGYTQTSRMWRPLIPKLTAKFTVIAPDLPGIGESEIPKDGLDMKTAAIRMHARWSSPCGLLKRGSSDMTSG